MPVPQTVNPTTTKTLTFADETQVHARVDAGVCVLSPSGVLLEMAPGTPLSFFEGYLARNPDHYLKVVTEWLCPNCRRVHGDQTDPQCGDW